MVKISIQLTTKKPTCSGASVLGGSESVPLREHDAHDAQHAYARHVYNL